LFIPDAESSATAVSRAIAATDALRIAGNALVTLWSFGALYQLAALALGLAAGARLSRRAQPFDQQALGGGFGGGGFRGGGFRR
jgi:hypothetical protein